MASGYAGKENPDLEDRINARIADMINLVERKHIPTSDTLQVMDFCKLASYFTLDVISVIAFGEPFGCLIRDADVYGYMKTFEDSGRVIQGGTIFPELLAALEKDWAKVLPGMPNLKDTVSLGRVVALAQQIVAKRFMCEKPEQMDVLGEASC
jgi:hypothetical protein